MTNQPQEPRSKRGFISVGDLIELTYAVIIFVLVLGLSGTCAH